MQDDGQPVQAQRRLIPDLLDLRPCRVSLKEPWDILLEGLATLPHDGRSAIAGPPPSPAPSGRWWAEITGQAGSRAIDRAKMAAISLSPHFPLGFHLV